jgi:hypothetical protein
MNFLPPERLLTSGLLERATAFGTSDGFWKARWLSHAWKISLGAENILTIQECEQQFNAASQQAATIIAS